MTIEERQLRAWVRSVFHHAALRWLAGQRRREVETPACWDGTVSNKENSTWPSGYASSPGDEFETIDAELWLLDCQPRLASRERTVLQALYQGKTPTDVAQTLRCHVSTIRRSIYRIRNQCPR